MPPSPSSPSRRYGPIWPAAGNTTGQVIRQIDDARSRLLAAHHALRRRVRLTPAARPPPRGDGHVVVHVVDARDRPGDLADVALEPFVRNRPGQDDAASFASHFH